MSRIISVVPAVLALLSVLAAPLRAEDNPPDAPGADKAAGPAQNANEGVVLQDNAPGRYVVVKGDTLWGISGKFLKTPWKWPELWGINKDAIRNPHRIYPGDVVVLDLSGATPRLRLEGAADGGMSRWSGFELQVSKLGPQMHGTPLNVTAIPTIPAKAIEPFLVRPLIVSNAEVDAAPMIVANTDQRVVVSAGDTAYVTGLDDRKDPRWQVYRKGRLFQDPDTKEVLGFEAVYLGDADVTDAGSVSTVQIVRANQEIATGDRLAHAPPLQSSPYIPRSPERSIRGRVIAGADNSVAEMGTYSVVIMNRGARDGIEVGHVLGLFRSEGFLTLSETKRMPLPEQRYGVLMVFRVFDKMSYGLVMASRRPVNVLDTVSNP